MQYPLTTIFRAPNVLIYHAQRAYNLLGLHVGSEVNVMIAQLLCVCVNAILLRACVTLCGIGFTNKVDRVCSKMCVEVTTNLELYRNCRDLMQVSSALIPWGPLVFRVDTRTFKKHHKRVFPGIKRDTKYKFLHANFSIISISKMCEHD